MYSRFYTITFFIIHFFVLCFFFSIFAEALFDKLQQQTFLQEEDTHFY